MLPVKMSPGSRARVWLLLLLVFASGFCGISYEVLYGRILGDLVGDQFTVSTTILLTFMLGIGAGMGIAHRCWSWLWLVELGIGVCAVGITAATPWLDRLLYASDSALMPVCIGLLLLPSLLIGISLPLFAGYLQRLSPGGSFSRAYAFYNLGAAATALLIEFWLVRTFGLHGATYVIAGINLLVGALLGAGFADVARAAPEREPRTQARNTPLAARPLVALVLVSIASAIFQLTMIKVSECLLGPFRETFALVLTTVLLGIALGSLLARRFSLSFSTLLQINLAGFALLFVVTWPLMQFYAAHYEEATANFAVIALLKLGVVLVLMLVPAMTFGATVPCLVASGPDLSRQSGRLLFWSALANAAGFLLMAFGLHRWLDYGVLFLVTAGLVALGLACYARFEKSLLQRLALLLMALVTLHQLCWNENLLYMAYDTFHSPEQLATTKDQISTEQRYKGRQDVFSLTRIDGRPYFFINGYISIPLDAPSEKVAGAFPAIFAPRTDQALVLGVGSGATAGTVAQLFNHTDAVEINDAVLEHLGLMHEFNFGLEHNPKAALHLDDGIHFVKSGQGSVDKYSLIINTVTTPRFFSSSKLYTQEFLRNVKTRLTGDGIYATYFDTRIGEKGADIILQTLASNFRHCAVGAIKAGYFFVLCSDQPVVPHQHRLVADHPSLAKAFLNEYRLRPDLLAYGLITLDARQALGDPRAPLNTTDRPELEFTMARLRSRGYPEFLKRLSGAIAVEPVRAAMEQAGMKFDPSQFLFHLENLLGGSPEIVQGWRHKLYAVPGFQENHLRRELAVVQRAAAMPGNDAATVHFHYANNLKDRGDYDAAISAYQTVLSLKPAFNDAWFNLGATFEKAGRYDEALRSYEKEAQVDKTETETDFRMGRVLLAQGRPGDALVRLEKARLQLPDNAELRTLLNQAQAQAGAGPAPLSVSQSAARP